MGILNVTSIITLKVCVMAIILPIYIILLQSINQQQIKMGTKTSKPQNQWQTGSITREHSNTSRIPLVAHLSLGSSLRSGSTCDIPARNFVELFVPKNFAPTFSKIECEFSLTKLLVLGSWDLSREILGIELERSTEIVDVPAIFKVREFLVCVSVFFSIIQTNGPYGYG